MECRHFGACGGCSLPGVPYDEQLRRKRARLADLLRVDVPPLIPSPRQAAFRQKAAFVFGSAARGGGLVMGHYGAGSKRIVTVEECPVHSARANRIAFAIYGRLARAGVAAFDRRGGTLRHLIVRATEDDSEAAAMLVVARNDRSLRAPIRGLLESPDAPDGFFLNINDRRTSVMVGDETIRIAGRNHVREKAIASVRGAGGVHFLVAPDAFFQTNVGAARELVALVLAAVGPAKRVLDLYCGTGLFAQPLAVAGAYVAAVEENRQAIDDLKAGVRLNGIPSGRIRPIAGRVEDVLPSLGRDSWDAVVLDPPRDGCPPAVLTAVFERIAPARAVYVSCNPEALARDLPAIRKSGYRIDGVAAVDMFPHTDHIETVATLCRVPSAAVSTAC